MISEAGYVGEKLTQRSPAPVLDGERTDEKPLSLGITRMGQLVNAEFNYPGLSEPGQIGTGNG